MLEIDNYENLLFTGDVPKGWVLRKSSIPGMPFHIVGYPTLEKLLKARLYSIFIALLDTGELVYSAGGWDTEDQVRSDIGTIYLGKGVIHGEIVKCQDR